MAMSFQPRFGAIFGAGAVALACGLPADALASTQQVGPMQVWWPGGGAMTSFDVPECAGCVEARDMDAPILTNLFWQGDDQTIKSHVELASPVLQTADAGYTFHLTATGFNVDMSAALQRPPVDDASLNGLPWSLPGAHAWAQTNIYFQLSEAVDLQIQDAGTDQYGVPGIGLSRSKRLAELTLLTWHDGASVDTWTSGNGSWQPTTVLHLEAGRYEFRAKTSADLLPSLPTAIHVPGVASHLNVTVAVVPEPGMAWLWSVGVLGMGAALSQGRGKRQG